MLSSLLTLPIVKEILIPALAQLFLKLVDRYHSDPEFAGKINEAATIAKNATTREEKLNASKIVQSALFRR